MAEKNNTTSLVLGGALLLIGLFVIIALVLVRSQAEEATVLITNVAPVVSAVKICPNDGVPSSCSHIANYTSGTGTTQLSDIIATVTDTNGIDDIDPATGVVAVVYRTGSGDSCGSDGNDCYILTCANEVGIGPTSAYFKCDIATQHYMDATTVAPFASDDWTIKVTATDATAGSHSATNTFEVTENASVAFSPSPIDYGELALGGTSATGFEVTGTNNGNADADAQIRADGANMTCSIDGTIPVGNQKFDTATDAYASMTTALTTGDQQIDFTDETGGVDSVASLCRRTSETYKTSDTAWFGITIPASGVGGTCTVGATVTTKTEIDDCTGNGA
ncbi:MAG: hypothetical protein ABIA47_05085 [bacterium]